VTHRASACELLRDDVIPTPVGTCRVTTTRPSVGAWWITTTSVPALPRLDQLRVDTRDWADALALHDHLVHQIQAAIGEIPLIHLDRRNLLW